jgi:hypothetical protein
VGRAESEVGTKYEAGVNYNSPNGDTINWGCVDGYFGFHASILDFNKRVIGKSCIEL